jgi:DNA-binding SARP family transcriptional activator
VEVVVETIGGLRIWLLGGFRAELDGRQVRDEAWRRNRARALVKILALAPSHCLHREQVIDTLWPALDVDSGSANLRKAAHFARQAIAPQHLRTRGELVELDASPLWVDVAEFEAAAQAGRNEEAVSLYRGDLLPEDRYEAWTDEARDRLRSQYQQLLLVLAADRERDGDLVAATQALERLVTDDPLHEEAHLALMRLHALGGARHLALRRFRHLEATLRAELDIAPATEVQNLYREILDGRFPSPALRPAWPDPSAPQLDESDDVVVEQRKVVTALWMEAVLPPGDPEVNRDQLISWAEKAAAVIERWGSIAETQAGGSLVAVFGVPRVHEDDATRALRAALEIRQSSVVPVRGGVSTGEVIVGMGTGSSAAAVAGEVLATAGRLRAQADPDSVLVAERTCRMAARQFRFAPAASIGDGSDHVQASAVLEVDDGLAIAEPDAPFVGRDAELTSIAGLVDDVIERRHSRLVLLVGNAGVGKTRLVGEVAVAVTDRHPGARVLRGRCLSAGRGSVYWALGEVLREACGIYLNESAETARRRLRRYLRKLLAHLDPTEVDETVFALATTAGIGLRDNPLDRIQPSEVAERLGLAWPRFTSACAATAPTLLVLEDMHWAAPEMVQMLELIVARSTGPLMVLATSRPELRERNPTFAATTDDASTIALPPLDRGQSERLLDSLLAGDPLAAGVRGDLLARADGNPLYLEQLSLHLRTGGSTILPDTLQSLLSARLDTLPPPERRVLQEAAVVGRIFWEQPLRNAVPDERLSARLAVLERKGFVVRRPTSSLPGQNELSFRHALLHDAAYESLPRARRARAHAEVGRWIEDLAGDRLDEVADLLAHHFWSACNSRAAELAWDDDAQREAVRKQAHAYLIRAGVAAGRRFATDRALELHNRAREIATGRDELLTTLEVLAEDHDSVYHGDSSAGFYREAIELADEEPAQPSAHSRLCRKLAWEMVWSPGAFASSPDPITVDELVAAAMATVDDAAEQAWLQLIVGASARLYRGSEPFGQGTRWDPRPIGERIDAAEQAVATGRALGRADLVTHGEHALAMLYGMAGRFADAITLGWRRVEGLGPESTRLEQCDAYRKLAFDLITINAEFEQGLALARRAHELAGGSSPHALMHTTLPLMTALFHLGRWDELVPLIDEHAAAFRAEPAMECQFVRDGPVIGALVLTLLGRLDEAHEMAALVGDPLGDLDKASAWQARYAVICGDPQTARTISADKVLERRNHSPQHALALVEALAALRDWEQLTIFLDHAHSAVDGNALLAPVADRAEGLALLARGDQAVAASTLRRSLRRFRELGTPWEEARTLEALAAVLPGAEADAARRTALTMFEQLGIAGQGADDQHRWS